MLNKDQICNNADWTCSSVKDDCNKVDCKLFMSFMEEWISKTKTGIFSLGVITLHLADAIYKEMKA